MNEVLNLINNYALIVSEKGIISFCNDKLLSKLNFVKDQVENTNIKTLLVNGVDTINFILDNLVLHKKISVTLDIKDNENEVIKFKGHAIANNDEENNIKIIFILDEKSKKIYEKEDLEVLLDSMPFEVWIKGIDGEYLYVNKECANNRETTVEQFIGKCDRDFWGEESYKMFREFDEEIINSKTSNLREEKILENGKVLYFETYKAPVFDKMGEVKYIGGISKDITLQKKLQYNLEQSHEKLTKLSQVINNECEYNINNFLGSVCEEILRHTGADNVALWTYNSRERNLRLEKGIWANGESSVCTIREFSINDEELECLNDSRDYEGLKKIDDFPNNVNRDAMKERGIAFISRYRILLNDELLGVITIAYSDNNKPKFKQDDYLNTICNQIGLLIKNYLLSEELANELKNYMDSEEEFELFLKTSVDLAAVIGDDGCFKKVSKEWNKIMGWSEEDLIGSSVKEYIHKDEIHKVINSRLGTLRADDKVERIETRCKCKNGEYRWLAGNAIYFSKKSSYLITARDITEEKIKEEERIKLQKTFEIESLKNEFFANISHEFKTPLNIIVATTQLLNRYEKQNKLITYADFDLKRYINSLRQNAFRLLRLINNLIDITKIDSGYFEVQLVNYDIVRIVEDITLSVAQYVEDNDIAITFDTDVEEEIIACDPDKIERIILNLLSNAIKYTNENGQIYVNINSDIKDVIISVEDNGVGIPAEKLDIIFERFKQIDSTLARKCEGSGIGLSLVKAIVDMHDGQIHVESSEGQGAKFIFRLPKRLADNTTNISIIEDDIINRKIEKCRIEFSDIYDLS